MPDDTERLDAVGDLGLTLVRDHIRTVDGWHVIWRCHVDEVFFADPDMRVTIDLAIEHCKLIKGFVN